MRALILDGSEKDDKILDFVRGTIEKELEKEGCEFDTFVLRELKIAPCTGCFGCWLKTPGECVINDIAQKIAFVAANSKAYIFLTPVRFGGYSSELKKAIDRLLCLLSPFFIKIEGEVRHPNRYKRGPPMLVMATIKNHDEEREGIFKSIVRRNAANIQSPRHIAEVIPLDTELNDIETKIIKGLRSLGFDK
jgi:multimeric flavodoxin WrbA